MKIPYIAIKWENHEDENAIIAKMTSLLSSKSLQEEEEESGDDDTDYGHTNQINIHPPSNTLMSAIIDLIAFYKWEYVTILFQETTGLGRIEDLIRVPGSKKNGVENKLRLQIRQLSEDVSKWIYLIKDVKLSGCSHIIVDIQNKYLNTFLEQANEVGLATVWFHFIFTTLDLDRLEYFPSANVTALQMYDLDDIEIKRVKSLFSLKNVGMKKDDLEFLPVS